MWITEVETRNAHDLKNAGIFDRRAMVDQAPSGPLLPERNLTFWCT